MLQSRHWFPAWVFFSLSLLGEGAWGEELSKPSVNALPLDERMITVDGLLVEAIWQSAKPATGFIQQRPQAGAPAIGETSVWVAYDETNLYLGASLTDPDPSLVRGDERQRDASLDRSDAFAVLIDTYHDHQNGFVFETNLLAAMSDAIVSQEGKQVNLDWNGLWEVAAQRTERGWSVEFRIPFETLRFEPGENQVWGIQFRRRVPHLNEISFWRSLTTEQNFHEVSRAGHLLGIEATRQEHRFSIKPYAKGSYQFSRTDRYDSRDPDQDAGIDLRYRFQTNLTLDLTFNTDFAETEVDRLQVNLTEFPLFFPEKREFFLEGRGFYDFGLSRRVEPFFSRRIGLVERQPVPIVGGGKLTGKVGPYGIGFLLMQTEKAKEVNKRAEQFGVLRLTRDLGVRSNIGMIATHLAESGEKGNQTVGVDTAIAPSPNLVANTFWLRTSGGGDQEPGHAGYGQINWQDPFWRFFIYHLRVEESFDPALGYIQLTDLSETQGYIDLRPQPRSGPIREFGFKGELTYQTDINDRFLYRSNYWRALAYFRTGEFVMFSWDPQVKRLPKGFVIRPRITIPAGTYHFERYSLFMFSDLQKQLSGTMNLKWGGFYGGTIRSLDLNLTLAPAEGLKVGAGWNINAVNLPQGNFESQTLDGNVAWSLSNEMLFQGLIQWNKEDDLLAANLRFSWEYQPGSHLFLIVNPSQQEDETTILFLVKLTWLWEPI